MMTNASPPLNELPEPENEIAKEKDFNNLRFKSRATLGKQLVTLTNLVSAVSQPRSTTVAR